MTVETQVAKVKANGNDSATVFSFSPIVIFEESDLVVIHVDSSGDETVLTEGVGASNYSVSVADFPGTGSITYPADEVTPLPTGESLVIKRVLPLEQTTDLENQGGYFPDVQETQFDKLLMIDIQQQEEIDRALTLPISSEEDAETVVTNLLLLASGSGIDTSGLVDDAVTNAKLANMAQATIKGRASGAGTGDPVDLTASQVRTIINVENGATADQTAGEIKTLYESNANTNAFTDADESKLDGIEAGATADQTGAEIKSAYEAEANTNAFTDAEQTKLAGIEANADVTDTTNVMASIDIGGVQENALPGAGDWVLGELSTGELRKFDVGNLPGAGAGSLDNIVEDTSPQLGGNLDVNGQSIVSVSAGNIAITPDTTGSIVLDGLNWPQADGSADQVLVTDGAGQLSWTSNAGSGIAAVVDDTTPQLGGNLDANGNRILADDGTEALPGLGFGDDLDSGFYFSTGGGFLAVTKDATDHMYFLGTGVQIPAGIDFISTNVKNATGTAGAPSYTFSGDIDTGLYRVGADSLGVSVGGTLRVTFNTANLTSTVPFLAPGGTASAPSYSFSGDGNTGIYSDAADRLGITAGGVPAARIEEVGGVVTVEIFDHFLTRAVIGDYAVQNASPASSSGTLTLDYTTGPDFDLELAENVTTISVTNPSASGNLAKVTLQLRQPTSGTHTVSFSGFDFGDAGAPTMPTGTGAILEVALWTRDGGTTWYGSTYFEKAGA